MTTFCFGVYMLISPWVVLKNTSFDRGREQSGSPLFLPVCTRAVTSIQASSYKMSYNITRYWIVIYINSCKVQKVKFFLFFLLELLWLVMHKSIYSTRYCTVQCVSKTAYHVSNLNVLWAVFRIRIRKFLGLQDPDLLVRGKDPDSDLDPDPSIIKRK